MCKTYWKAYGEFFLKRLKLCLSQGLRAELESGEGSLLWTRDQGRLQGGRGPKDGQGVGVAGRWSVTDWLALPFGVWLPECSGTCRLVG